MLKCKITFKGQEFADAKEFANYIKSQPISVFEDFESSLGKIISEKYSSTAEDSVAEVMTKLKAEKAVLAGEEGAKILDTVSQSDIDKYLYPEGQLTDYVTQSRIHANTYAGVKGTGISAAFSKMFAYLFSATPITEVTDTSSGVSYSVEDTKAIGKLLAENKVSNVRELVLKNKKFKISKKANPKVKAHSMPIVNNYKFSEFSRNELNYDGTPKTLFKGIAGKELLINVFETIDTIINLAIDNVKEQKLFILGFTNSNATALLSAIGFGIPLNDVARIFNSEVVVEESKAKRLYPQNLTAKINNLLKETTDEELTNYLKATGQTKLNNSLDAVAQEYSITKREALKKYANSDGTTYLNMLSVDTKILDEVFVGKSEHKKMSDIAALAMLAKLSNLGSELFSYSRIFSLLRKLPSNKWQMDNIAKLPLNYVNFKQVDVINREVKNQTKNQITSLFQESDDYKNAADPEAALQALRDELDKDSSVYGEELKRRQRTWFLNRLGRNDLVRSMEPSESSAFSNVTILSIPHVYTAWRTLNKMIRVVEQTFALHSPRINTLAQNVIGKIKAEGAWVKGDLQELIQNNFVKFLTSNLKIQLGDKVHDMGVDPNMTYVNPVGTGFRGEEAWTQSFIADISQHLSKDNELLKSIEIKTERDEKGTKRLLLTADKVGDDELVETLKRDFLTMAAIDPMLPINLFKYAIITSGLYYGRTNFSLIFPAEYALAFDQALNARLDTVITSSNIKTDINMRVIEDQFLYQFVRNNPGVLSYVNRIKPIPSGFQETQRGHKRRILAGMNGEVYYDLKFPKVDGVQFDRIIKTYGTTTYIQLDTPLDNEFVYYRVFTTSGIDSTFSFDEADLDTGFNMAKLYNPTLKLLTLYRKKGDVVSVYTSQKDFKEGDIIFLNPKLAKLTKLEAYQVQGVSEERTGKVVTNILYTVKRLEAQDMDLSHKEMVNKLKDKPYYLEVGISSKEAEVAISQQQALLMAKRPGTLAIVGTLTGPLNGAYSIDLTQSVEGIIEAFNKIPNSKKYVVDKTLIDVILRTYPAEASKIATILYAKTGFEHEIVGKSEEEAEIDAKIAKAFKIQDITATRAPAAAVSADRTLVLESFDRPSQVRQGAIVHLGQATDGQDIFGHVVNVEKGVATISYIDSVLFDFLSNKFYTVEELSEIAKKINRC